MELIVSNLYSKSKISRITMIIPTIFIIVGLFAAFNHSLWRDEMQGWLVAKNSIDLVDLEDEKKNQDYRKSHT